MSNKLITPPAIEPITLAEAKLHLRVDGSEDDALITTLIAAARQHAEHITERVFIEQTWELALDAFPSSDLRLPKANLLSVASIKYDDTAGAEQTLAGAAYSVDTYAQPGWVMPVVGGAWPATLAAANAVRIRYTAGYGNSAAAVPAGIKSWLLLRIGTLHKYREELVDGRNVAPSDVDRLLDEYRLWLL